MMPEQVQSREDEKAELAAILASETFSRSPNLAKLLRYICNKYWEGKAEELKEYNLAVEALGRPPDFDPTITPTARVEMHRLREKLKKYYETEGFNQLVVIVLPPGSYFPRFIRREEITTAEEGSIHPAGGGQLGMSHVPPTMSAARAKATPPHAKNSGHPGTLPVGGGKNLVRWLPGLVIAALALGFLAILVVAKLRHARSSHASPTTLQLNVTPTSTVIGAKGPVRIIAGYLKDKYIDSAGNVWSGDRLFTGGGDLGTSPRRFVSRTRDPTLFNYGRSGDFSYDIPLKPGKYELRLYFEEAEFGPGTVGGRGEGTRVFGIDLNGKSLLPNFDPYTDTGGNFIADVRVFKDVAPASDGYLHLKFRRTFAEPLLNALEIIPSTHGKLTPIRMVAQDYSFADGSGNVWEPDRHVIGGVLVLRTTQVQGASDPDLYAGERWGAFNYAIPVAEGKYGLTLYFAETYWGSLSPGGVGSRVFDVYYNGLPLLRNFDIFKEAGGPNRALQKTFHRLRPDAHGKLMLTFDPVENYACINAIEVVDESD